MPRIGHGGVLPLAPIQSAGSVVADLSIVNPFSLAADAVEDLQAFSFLFPALQDDPAALLTPGATTHADLVRLGKTMHDLTAPAAAGDPPDGGDAALPALLTYLGQFIDHDITLEATSFTVDQLLNPAILPHPVAKIVNDIRNTRTAPLDLDSLYESPAVRDVDPNVDHMLLGDVSDAGPEAPPTQRPPNKPDNGHDVPRMGPHGNPAFDRSALIGDPRNDENTIVAQLQVAFLRAHNAIVALGNSFAAARRLLIQHYQHIVLNDFLMKIADPAIVTDILTNGQKVYNPPANALFMPLEFSVAAFRFGHSMVRPSYDFNLNFNVTAGGIPATLDFLFTFTALSGQLGTFPTLPDNWIIEWENFTERGGHPLQPARRIDTKLVEPLFDLRAPDGTPLLGDRRLLAVRNLLRGYLLRMPTGQAVATALGFVPLTAAELEAVAAPVAAIPGGERQEDVLRTTGFSTRTPLWYYILAEAAATANGEHLGPVGSTIVADVLLGLMRRSEHSIIDQNPAWAPTLPGATPGQFTIKDLLVLAGVLSAV